MSDTDISDTLAAKVDQITFEDFRPPIERTVTITGSKVTKGADQPVVLTLEEFPGRPYKPGKSMRRVLAAIWGTDSAVYVGRRLRLYGDPTIMFGGLAVGGIRIRAMSHLDKPQQVAITVTKGQKKPFTVQPLKDAPNPTATHLTALETAATLEALQAAWVAAGRDGVTSNPAVVAMKDKRKGELS